jgi:hypothetical protein
VAHMTRLFHMKRQELNETIANPIVVGGRRVHTTRLSLVKFCASHTSPMNLMGLSMPPQGLTTSVGDASGRKRYIQWARPELPRATPPRATPRIQPFPLQIRP